MHPPPSQGLTLAGFERLFSIHRKRVYGYACHYLRDDEEAADVTQEVFIRMWKHREEIEEDRLLPWLLRVTRNACVDSIRRRAAYRKRVATNSEVVDLQSSAQPGPDRKAASSLFREHLQRALDTLDEPYKSIVILREIEEFKYEEISDALELPLNTVKVYLHRARKALRKELSEVSNYEYA
jgi:RNA polymerase sigma-70 factor (ECF subfamily)